MATRYYSTREVCAILGVTRATLYNWEAKPDIRLIGALGWSRRTVEAMGRAHQRTPNWDAVT